jgi:hypothetical protein
MVTPKCESEARIVSRHEKMDLDIQVLESQAENFPYNLIVWKPSNGRWSSGARLYAFNIQKSLLHKCTKPAQYLKTCYTYMRENMVSCNRH